MLSETLVSAILTSSITGAGLVIAFFALIAKMSDSIFSCRFGLLEEKNQEVEQIRNNPESFKGKNLNRTSSRLKELGKEIDSFKTFPKYLAIGVGISFLLFILTAVFSLTWLYNYVEPYVPTLNDYLLYFLYIFSIGLFLVVGFLGLVDVRETLKIQFNNLAKKKTEIKQEIKYAPKVAEILSNVTNYLKSIGVNFETYVSMKVDGLLFRPDILISFKNKPEYVIEVMYKPNINSIYTRSRDYEVFKEKIGVKTILIADIRDDRYLLSIAHSYWDYTISSTNIDYIMKELPSILRKSLL